ncbi:DUF1697 domain-containing protein [Blastococcus jejuensis]|uniref:DUF1697 domain-containing protein n=1 Tax=Blastococcus jejuensis TaxID=351224 RepID=A0ABP6PI29_9ACTN
MADTRYVVLLRGINLGKARQVAMPRLREVLTGRGHEAVRTHLRSGNVLLDSPLDEGALAADVRAVIEQEFGFEVPVVVRTAAEVAAVVAGDPFESLATDPARYLVTFLQEPPPPDKVDALPTADGGDYLVRGRELYLWLPDGIQNTPLAAWKWDRLLGIPGTARNWNTVTKLAELAR